MSRFIATNNGSPNWWWTVPLGATAYVAITALAGRLGLEHLALAVGLSALALGGRKARAILLEAAPFFVFLVGYDLFRYPRAALITADRVLGCEVRALERSLFSAGSSQSWPEYFAAHNTVWFDVIAAVPYSAFIFVVGGYGIFLYFQDRVRMRRFLWAFTIGNYVAFAVWLVFPAAPPWYILSHGCEIDAGALPSAAALTRVDALLGLTYFHDLYSQSAMVFGALPSLHCAYPVMGLLVAWPHATWKTRPIHIAYSALMAVSAVYLTHHWMLDVIAGWLVALFSVWASTRLLAAVGARSTRSTSLTEPSAFQA